MNPKQWHAMNYTKLFLFRDSLSSELFLILEVEIAEVFFNFLLHAFADSIEILAYQQLKNGF